MATNSSFVSELRPLVVQWLELTERLFDQPDVYASLGGAPFLAGLTGHTDIDADDVIAVISSIEAIEAVVVGAFHVDNLNKMRS